METIPPVGSYGCLRMHGTAGRLIRLGQWLNGDGFKDYEHAFVYVGNGHIVQAEPHGAQLASVPKTGVLWSTQPLTAQQGSAIAAAAIQALGTPYSYLDYIAIAMHRFGLNVPGLKRYIGDSGHMICSQLVAACYLKAGINLCPDEQWDGYVTPGDLAQLVRPRG